MPLSNNLKKTDLKSAYAGFLNSPAGQDFIKQAQLLEKAYVLQAVKSETSDQKAHSVSKMEGVVSLRDYVVRMAKPGTKKKR